MSRSQLADYRPGLNLCRQYIQWFNSVGKWPYETELQYEFVQAAGLAFHFAKQSHKFQLPAGGVLIDDVEMRALCDLEVLSLPFDRIALEFLDPEVGSTPGRVRSSKRIVFAAQTEDRISMFPVSYFDADRRWVAYPMLSIPRRNFLLPNYRSGLDLPFHVETSYPEVPIADYELEVLALFSMLNALACSNVSISRFRSAKKDSVKAALPFDDFHVLTISPGMQAASSAGTGSNRSPREHLRRGHIRRLESGRKVWVNAAVVAAGRAAGRVFKAYSVNGLNEVLNAGMKRGSA